MQLIWLYLCDALDPLFMISLLASEAAVEPAFMIATAPLLDPASDAICLATRMRAFLEVVSTIPWWLQLSPP